MSRALVPLSMANLGLLPDRCRACVAWEIPGDTGGLAENDRVFEKDVWLSGVMLTWGSAGLIATIDDRPAGFVLYAPPTAVSSANSFPTAPVSPDAVLLTTARIDPGFAGQGLGRYLMNGMVSALTRRGVRAVEAFGWAGPPAGTSERPDSSADPAEPDRDASEADRDRPGCLLPADFLRTVGFTDVAAHHRFPRLRYELESGLDWKAEVEAALEKLFTEVVLTGSRSRELVGSGSRAASARVRPTGRAHRPA